MQSGERWSLLYEVASSQSGYFTLGQAAQSCFSPQLLEHHVRAGRLVRIQRGIYRLVHYPTSEHDDLVVLWLWSEQTGVFSHGTALALHELSDYMPVRYHLTLPINWRGRRLRTPPNLALFYADLQPQERALYGCFTVTSVKRTLKDCRDVGVSPEWLLKAEETAIRRGLMAVSRKRVVGA